MNSRILSIGVFMMLMLSSLLAGRQGYFGAKEAITADLNQALMRTLEERQDNIVAQDSIRAYEQLREASDGPVWLAIADRRLCRHLKDERLRGKTFLSFEVIDAAHPKKAQPADALCSDTLIINNRATGTTLAVKSYARLSAIGVFRMSDQRLSFLLAFAAFLWAIGFRFVARKRQTAEEEPQRYGGLSYSAEERCFYDARRAPVHLTPMQHRFLLMLWQAPSHSVSKDELCAALWPKKEDANDTLYTLVRRLKPILETCSELQIVAHRGRNYSLEIKAEADCQDNVRKMSAAFLTER